MGFFNEALKIQAKRSIFTWLNESAFGGLIDGSWLFNNEVAILRQFRGGLSPIQFLIRPAFEMGNLAGVQQALFWTSRASLSIPWQLPWGLNQLAR